jgi:hypothetical protein
MSGSEITDGIRGDQKPAGDCLRVFPLALETAPDPLLLHPQFKG